MIKLIWAMDEDWIIGLDNKLPWRIKEDLLYYKEKIAGKTVLMGYNTYLSLKGYYKDKPLPFGDIYVVTKKRLLLGDATIISDLDSFMKSCDFELFVVGGSSIYSQTIKYASYLYISFIKGKHEGNVYFPKFSLDDFKLISENETSLVRYTIYERK